MKKNDFIFLLVSTTIMVFAYIIFNLLHISKTSTVTDVLNQQIEQIQPNFDTKTIDVLKQRQRIDPLYQLQNQQPSQASVSATPTQTILSPPQASQGTTVSASLYQGGAFTQ